MKATGIVRKIDNLGRIVIPKEIRRILRIHEGDPLEIYTDVEGKIVLKKYSASLINNKVQKVCQLCKEYDNSLQAIEDYRMCFVPGEDGNQREFEKNLDKLREESIKKKRELKKAVTNLD